MNKTPEETFIEAKEAELAATGAFIDIFNLTNYIESDQPEALIKQLRKVLIAKRDALLEKADARLKEDAINKSFKSKF